MSIELDLEEKAESYLIESFKSDAASAEIQGMMVVRSTPETLLLDLDSGAALDRFRYMMPRLIGQFPHAKETARWKSKSGNGWHIVVALPDPLSVPERLLLQSALGSDPMRDLLGLIMYREGNLNPIMLFKPKEAGDGGTKG